jgi:hypothetical protein
VAGVAARALSHSCLGVSAGDRDRSARPQRRRRFATRHWLEHIVDLLQHHRDRADPDRPAGHAQAVGRSRSLDAGTPSSNHHRRSEPCFDNHPEPSVLAETAGNSGSGGSVARRDRRQRTEPPLKGGASATHRSHEAVPLSISAAPRSVRVAIGSGRFRRFRVFPFTLSILDVCRSSSALTETPS